MKRTINLSICYFLIFALFIFSFVNLFIALNEQSGINNALDINSISSAQIEEGVFLSGTVDDYLIKEAQSLLVPASANVGANISIAGENSIYAIRLKDNKYIQLFIKNSDSIELLNDVEAFLSSDGINVQAKIVPNDYVNYDWYKLALKLETDSEIRTLLVTDLAIQEVNFSDTYQKIRNYSLLILLAIVLFTVTGGFKNFILKNKIPSDKCDEFVITGDVQFQNDSYFDK